MYLCFVKFYYRFYCIFIAAKSILSKMIKICSNAQENITVLYFSLKLYLYALSYYTSGMDDGAEQIIAECISKAKDYLIEWLHRPDIGYGANFGGNNSNKLKDEIKVCGFAIFNTEH